jgi:D-alanyl-lipoteichoic acid acyltransferase DltB (MBOAT superfamily)
MLFNSGLFLQFFAAFLLLYYMVRGNLPARNLLIVTASYLFYGAWNYKFLVLLLFSSVFDFYIGLALGSLKEDSARKRLVALSVFVNLLILGFFKYYNFFIDSFADLSRAFGFQPNLPSLQIILPVGISFYTFQSMSYALDIYRREIPPTRNLIHFLAFVSFFPQLVAGPIERARHLLPQFSETRHISIQMIREGLWLCIWGMFKKVVVADNLAPLVEMIYGQEAPAGPMVALATLAFALQIYGDFSGYSDIARGTARILGFDIMLNFNLPYTASSMREFWQRWHISLSTWLRDYLYIPLGGNRCAPARTSFNLMLTMLLGGLWHGARWNFVLWGAWHGLALVLHRRNHQSSERPRSFRPLGWLATMFVVLYGWMLFRAESFQHVATLHLAFSHWTLPIYFSNYLLSLFFFSLPILVMEVLQRRGNGPLTPLSWHPTLLGLLQGILIVCILIFWEREKVPFIYFQF